MQNISKLFSLVGVIKCNTLQDSHLFTSPFVKTTGYSRNCMKMGNHDRPRIYVSSCVQYTNNVYVVKYS